MTAPHLEAHVRTRLGSFDLDAAFTANRRGVTALFGPSGSGKTSALRVLAGLHRPDAGTLRVGEETWIDTDRGLFLRPHRRAIGYVFQEASLLPHLSVRENLTFGLRRTPTSERTIAFDDVVDWLGLSALIDRDGGRLSGGERQRVAIGRALLTSPRLLLMDEPMSALDEASRDAILPYLETLRDTLALPVIYVTHDLDELARLADDIVWIEGGKVRAAGAVAALLPRIDDTGRRVAALVEGTVLEHDDADGLSAVSCRFGRMWVRRLDREVGDTVRIRVAARDVSLALDEEARDSILNVFAGVVTEIRPINTAQVLVDVRCGDGDNGDVLVARITRRSLSLLEIAVGRRLFAKVKSASLES